MPATTEAMAALSSPTPDLWLHGTAWLQVLANGVAVATSILVPVFLMPVIRRRTTSHFHSLIVMLTAFAVVCGTSYALAIATLWQPLDWLTDSVSIVQALAFVGVGLALWQLLPKVLAMPSNAALIVANGVLEKRAAQACALAKFTQRALIRVDLADLADEAVELLHAFLGGERSALLFMGYETKTLAFKAGRGWNDQQISASTFSAEDSAQILCRVKGQEKAAAACIAKERLKAILTGADSEDHTITHSALIHGGKLAIGTLSMFYPHTQEASQEELNFLQSIANVLGIAYEREQNEVLMLELTRSNTELEHFSYVASHDLQEPLRKITSFSQLLSQSHGFKPDSEELIYINYIVDGVKRMQILIDDVLSYSKIGVRQAHKNFVELDAVLQEAMSNLDSQIAESHALIVSDKLPLVRGEQSFLVRLMQNLVGNAVKYRGKLAPLIKISVRTKPEEWVIGVHDNGIGIEPAQLDSVFEIFRRLHGRGKYPGTGIGLAVCKKIVQQWGGLIWAESADQGGTVFYFTIPRDDLEKQMLP